VAHHGGGDLFGLFSPYDVSKSIFILSHHELHRVLAPCGGVAFIVKDFGGGGL